MPVVMQLQVPLLLFLQWVQENMQHMQFMSM